ncbi:MAG: 4-hydroxythreonine-4-phosphate dehydrogenase [uncultured Chloroflexi bacterium]|uniref:4-hydroxythreonine-4-phosphate dehydrogenase n=1 Tax=uncultured Chloroflexota bacterium TaxID=166587 RepID=A0A6J4IMK0_9CHLR|nr:MAG: 4-hydroxythreonine-4-phosphate dehydrogenase [uncultured Chloroflexota bacterium]
MSAASSDVPRIGLVLGDPSGIGPEVCAKLLASGAWRSHVRLHVVGDPRVLAQAAQQTGVALPDDVPVDGAVPFDPSSIRQGVASAAAGRVAGEWLKRAVKLAVAGELEGVCYAPLNKSALNLGGWHYPDDLNLFAAITAYAGPQGTIGELNVQPHPHGDLWTSRVTSHVPLKDVARHVTQEAVQDAIHLIHSAVRRSGVAQPRIAIAALNPHAGDGGLCGDEEATVIAPAIERARATGVTCDGPFAADTIFLRARRPDGVQNYEAVVSMYHDQGQIATKLLGFSRGVTALAGLPVVLTTPAHGTAHDIAGKGLADPGALEQAVRLAARLARQTIVPSEPVSDAAVL